MFVVLLKSLNQYYTLILKHVLKKFLNSAYNIFKLDKPFTFDDLAGIVKQNSLKQEISVFRACKVCLFLLNSTLF